MTFELDCRGLACPAPVLEAKKAIDTKSPSDIVVTVDNEAAKENISRFLDSQGFEVSIREEGRDFYVSGTKRGGNVFESAAIEEQDPEKQKIMVMVATDRVGYGDDELGLKLMQSFLKTLQEMGDELWRLVFVNSGVKLTIEDSEALPDLRKLEELGTLILVCGTCLNHFGILDKKQVGETTNMLDIVTAMQLADKVINI
jgi:selenium metabolism protein YedF